jgi:hypothetical protein
MRFFLVILFCAVSAPADIEKLALIIGNNHGLVNEEALGFAERDAIQVQEVLTTLGSVEKDRCYLLLNQSKDKVTLAFSEIIGRAKEVKKTNAQIMLFIYFSGHGSPGYFHLNGKKLPLTQIREWFASADVDFKIFIADACYSGSLLDAKGGRIGAPLSIKVDDTISTSGAVILTSSSGDEQANESKKLKSSLFTFHLLSGLRGAADYDKNKNVTLWEMLSYAGTQTKAITSGALTRQHPEFDINMAGTDEIVISQLQRSNAHLTLMQCSGTYDIIDETTADICAEVHAQPHDTITLALDAGRYQIRQVLDDRVLNAPIDLTWDKSRIVTHRDLKPFPIDAFVQKGNVKYNSQAVSLSLLFLKGVPAGTWAIPEVAYTISLFKSDVSFQAGFTRNHLAGNNLGIDQSVTAFGADYRYHIVNRARYRLSLVSRIQLMYLYQKPLRNEEARIQSAGYSALPAYRACTAGPFCGGSIEVQLPVGLLFSVKYMGGAIIGRNANNLITVFPRAMSEIAIGKAF